MRRIIPITDLQRKPGEIVSSLAESEEPIIITQRGRPSAVLLAVDRYEQMEEDMARLDQLELEEMVANARKAISAGETISHSEVKKKLAKRRTSEAVRPRRAR
ncbi:MAG: type II toxin-antitoxin system Phd/YefM family antitoxin [Blastocatellia bacterium]